MRPRKVVWRAALLAIAATVTVSGLTSVSSPASAAGPRPLFQLPVACKETWRLQTYAAHNGSFKIDFHPTQGTAWGRPILASYGGVVDFAGIDGTLGSKTPFNPNAPHGTGGGYMVGISHGNGWRTIYLHMLEWPMVTVGQTVSIGQQIGRIGSTGDSGAPHLHYEQQADGVRVESWFDGVPSGITQAGDYSVLRTSNNCSGRQVYEAGSDNGWRPLPVSGPGGPVTGSDAAALVVNGVRYVYTIRNGQVYEARNNNGWQPVALSGSSGPVTGSAVAAVTHAGVRYVYTIKNGQVYEASSSNGWRPLLVSGPGGPVTGTEIAAAVDNGVRLVYTVKDSQVYEAANDNGWRPLPVSGPGGPVIGSDVAALVQGGVRFVYTTHHGQVYEAANDNGWRPLAVSGPGGPVTGSVVAAISTKTVRYVYAIKNGQVYEAANDNGWRPLLVSGPGGVVTGSAVAAVTSGGVKYLYAL